VLILAADERMNYNKYAFAAIPRTSKDAGVAEVLSPILAHGLQLLSRAKEIGG
jgi:hypothetical protein